jgi:hypothetical protein
MDGWMDGGCGQSKKDAFVLAVEEIKFALFLQCYKTHGYSCMTI